MASSKKYAYYLRGNQIALIEENTGLGTGTCSLSDYKNKAACENAGGTWTENSTSGRDLGQYKSPQTDSTNGLEIEYAYSPRYRIATSSTTQVNKFYINGWTIKDGYLAFLRSHSATVPSWDSSPYSSVGDDEHILVRGSKRWNGLHKIKDTGNDGILQTYTKVSKAVPVVAGSANIDIAAESSSKALISSNDSSNIWLNNLFSEGEYIFIRGSATAKNNGFWKIDSVAADASAESSSGIYIANRYYCYDSDNTLDTEGEDTSVDTTATSNESLTIYKAYRDFCYIQSDIDVINNEEDTIDVPEYLAKALVYYVKAKIMEDSGEIDGMQYNMTQFRALMNRYENSRIYGTRRVAPGYGAIR